MLPDLNERCGTPLALQVFLLIPHYIYQVDHQWSFGSLVIHHRVATIYLESDSYELHQITAAMMYVPLKISIETPALQRISGISTKMLKKGSVSLFLTVQLFS